MAIDQMTLLGATVAGYRVEAVAGRGGMGIVYRARQLRLDRPVALKVITPDLASDAKFRARFVRESRIAASLDHPNVIPVHEAGEDDGRLFIAMRLVEGTDLAALIRDRGPLDPRLAAAVVAQSAAALDAAHARGLVHRDVKPANILLAGDPAAPHVYLTDFGLAKRHTSSGGLTTADGWIGTPDYAAPEQIDGGEVDARTDVYALGCVLFAALAGRPPFDTGGALAKAWAHVHATPPPVRELAPAVPEAFEAVLRRALAKRPADRFATTGELGRAALSAAGIGVAPLGGAPGEAATARLAGGDPTTARLEGAAGPGTPAATVPVPDGRTARLAHRERRPAARLVLAAAALLAAAAAAAAALLGAFSTSHAQPRKRLAGRPATAAPRPPAPPSAPSADGDTVRCDAATCRQGATVVSPPIEGAPCSRSTGPGRWSRIDAGAQEPMLTCLPNGTPTAARTAPLTVPDLAGARLDLAEQLLGRLDAANDTSGGGTFGPIVDSNWTVCATQPPAAAALPPGAQIKLFIDRSC